MRNMKYEMRITPVATSTTKAIVCHLVNSRARLQPPTDFNVKHFRGFYCSRICSRRMCIDICIHDLTEPLRSSQGPNFSVELFFNYHQENLAHYHSPANVSVTPESSSWIIDVRLSNASKGYQIISPPFREVLSFFNFFFLWYPTSVYIEEGKDRNDAHNLQQYNDRVVQWRSVRYKFTYTVINTKYTIQHGYASTQLFEILPRKSVHSLYLLWAIIFDASSYIRCISVCS